MKLKITPLLLFSIGLFLYGLYLVYLFRKDGSWGMLAAIVTTACGIAAFILYLISRAIFKSRIRTEVIVELIIIAAVVIYVSIANAR